MDKRILLAVPFLATFPLIACGPGSHSGAVNKAKTPALSADAQLAKDGYRPLHVPVGGHADVGIKISGTGYEAVYQGKDAELVKTAVDEASKHTSNGVAFKAAGTNAVISAPTLSALKDGVQEIAIPKGA